jgi:PAS domain-containing protein
MLLVKRSVLTAFFTVTILASIAASARAFQIMTAAGLEPGELRFKAETLLFAVIVGATLLTAVFILIIFRSRNIDKMLDKLIRQNNMNPSSTREGLLRLGKTGGKLNLLYRQIDEISEKRGLKISAISNALSLFSANLTTPVLMTDLSGRIVQASRGWSEDLGNTDEDLIGSSIEDIFDGISITDIILRLEKTHLPVETVLKGTYFIWSRINDKENTPGYLIVMPAKNYKSRPN